MAHPLAVHALLPDPKAAAAAQQYKNDMLCIDEQEPEQYARYNAHVCRTICRNGCTWMYLHVSSHLNLEQGVVTLILLLASCAEDGDLALSWSHRQEGRSPSHFRFFLPQASQLRRMPYKAGVTLLGLAETSPAPALLPCACTAGAALEVSIQILPVPQALRIPSTERER